MDQGRGLWELLFGVSDPDVDLLNNNQVKLEDSQTPINCQMDLSDDLLALLGESDNMANHGTVGKDLMATSSFDLTNMDMSFNDLPVGIDLETLQDLSAYLQSSEFHSASSVSSGGSEEDGLSSLDCGSVSGSPKSSHSGCTSDTTNDDIMEELILSKEELILLKKEGLTLPKRYPLTKQEERTLKKIRRKIRNKKSAQESRRKKKVYVDQLEDQVKDVVSQNKILQRRVKELEKENVSLQQQLRTLQNIFGRATRHTKATGTCLMALVLSVALIVSPYTQNAPVDGEKDVILLGDYQVENVSPVRSRVIVNNMDVSLEPKPFGIPLLAKDGFRLPKETYSVLASGGAERNGTSINQDHYIAWKAKTAKENGSVTLHNIDSYPVASS